MSDFQRGAQQAATGPLLSRLAEIFGVGRAVGRRVAGRGGMSELAAAGLDGGSGSGVGAGGAAALVGLIVITTWTARNLRVLGIPS